MPGNTRQADTARAAQSLVALCLAFLLAAIAIPAAYGQATEPLTTAEMDDLRRVVTNCWVVPSDIKPGEAPTVRITFALARDGNLVRGPTVTKAARMDDPVFRALAESAIAAIHRCVPLSGLPAEKYERWKDITMSFNPQQLLRSSGAQAQFDHAWALYTRLAYAESETAFRAFLTNNPSHELAGQAHYWLGDTHYIRQQFAQAAAAFSIAYAQYPRGPRAPDSLLKLALSQVGLGNTADACLSLTRLANEYPQAETVLRRALQERSRIGCP